MDYPALLALIQADAGRLAMAEAGDDVGVAASLNAPTIAVAVQYQLTTLKVLDVLGPIRGTAVMTALRSLPAFGEIVKLMDDIGAGVNLKHPDADAMFGLLVSDSVVTQTESDSLLALRLIHIGEAEHALGQPVTHIDVALAWAQGGG